MLELDGATGEGSGQILRSALTLDMITGQPFRIRNVSANRAKSGLTHLHLVISSSIATRPSAPNEVVRALEPQLP